MLILRKVTSFTEATCINTRFDQTVDDDGGGPISNLVYKHNLKAAWFGGPLKQASLDCSPIPVPSNLTLILCHLIILAKTCPRDKDLYQPPEPLSGSGLRAHSNFYAVKFSPNLASAWLCCFTQTLYYFYTRYQEVLSVKFSGLNICKWKNYKCQVWQYGKEIFWWP